MGGVEPRSAREIGERSLILGFVLSTFRLRGQDERSYAPLMVEARGSLRPSDEELLDRGHWSEATQRDLLWQVECLHVLLWSVGKLSALPPIEEMADPTPVIAEINRMAIDPVAWLATLARRTDAELDRLDASLGLLRPHARIGPTGEVIDSIVVERSRAVRWIRRELDDWWDHAPP